MSGNKEGGIKARDANLAKDPDFYSKIGRKGGKLSNNGGFASPNGREIAKIAGSKGGKISKPGKRIKYTLNGQKMTILEISAELGVCQSTIRSRFKKYGNVYGN